MASILTNWPAAMYYCRHRLTASMST